MKSVHGWGGTRYHLLFSVSPTRRNEGWAFDLPDPTIVYRPNLDF